MSRQAGAGCGAGDACAGSPNLSRRHSVFAALRLAAATVVTGIGAGVAAALLNLVLHLVEHAAWGASEEEDPTGFVSAGGPRLCLAMLVSGLVGGLIWYLLRRYGRDEVSLTTAMDGRPMPIPETSTNVVLQVAQVGAGASVGRENAPRVAGAMLASHLCRLFRLTDSEARILIASAAGAGLAAAYQLPLAGAVFAVEVLAIGLSARSVAIALATSAIATVSADLIVPVDLQYPTAHLVHEWQVYVAALLVGLIAGPLGYGFRKLARRQVDHAPRGAHILWQMPVGFLLVGLIASVEPQVLGNGKFAAREVLLASPALGTIAVLAVLKLAAVLVSLRSGAVGGTLTPGFSLGTLCGALLWASVWALNPDWVCGLPLAYAAILGGAAFLSTSTGAPLFALLVAAEFTGQGPVAYPALFLAVSAAALATPKPRFPQHA